MKVRMVGGRGGKSPFSTHKSPCTPWRFKVKGVEKAGSKQVRYAHVQQNRG